MSAGLMVCSSVDGPALEARVLLGPVFFPILACVYGGGGHKQSLKGALGKEEGRGRKEGKSGHAQPLGPLQAPELPRDPFAAARPGPERGEISKHKDSLKGALGKEEGKGMKEGRSGHATATRPAAGRVAPGAICSRPTRMHPRTRERRDIG